MEVFSITDEVGGVHEEGLGWNPQGHFCGECSKMSCKGCFWEKYVEKASIERFSN